MTEVFWDTYSTGNCYEIAGQAQGVKSGQQKFLVKFLSLLDHVNFWPHKASISGVCGSPREHAPVSSLLGVGLQPDTLNYSIQFNSVEQQLLDIQNTYRTDHNRPLHIDIHVQQGPSDIGIQDAQAHKPSLQKVLSVVPPMNLQLSLQSLQS